MYAPKFDHCLWVLDDRRDNFCNGKFYDEASYKLIDEIMDMLKQISPCSENGCRELWFCLERGPIEEFGDYEELLADGEVENYEDYVKWWKDEYPDEYKWYHFYGLETDEKYQMVEINNKTVIHVNPDNPEKSFPYEISDFASFLKIKVGECIEQLKDGTYMDFIRPRIPVTMKTGTILQSELWELDPEEKKAYFEGLTDDDIAEFVDYMAKQDHTSYEPQERIPQMSANDFYRFCSMGYKAIGYTDCDLPLRAQYKSHADGRDDDLGEIDPDSPDAFKRWLTEERKHGGHPWEVCRGGNSTHISLYVRLDEGGYYLSLVGSSYVRSPETIKFYLALKRNNIPVQLRDGDHISSRVQGKEKVGVVPQGIIPRYRYSDFPGEDIISFMNLPYEDIEAYAAKCVWQEIREITLIDA